jgi:hypothetical protein
MKGHLQRPRELNQTSHHVNIDPPIGPQDPEHHTRPTNQHTPAPTINPKKRAYWIASEIRLSIHSVSGQNEFAGRHPGITPPQVDLDRLSGPHIHCGIVSLTEHIAAKRSL